jgi:hypothetical protein
LSHWLSVRRLSVRLRLSVRQNFVRRQLPNSSYFATGRVNQGSPQPSIGIPLMDPLSRANISFWGIRAKVPWLRCHLETCAMTEAVNVVSFLFLGFFLGMRHATDADHVVAIATIVSRQRSVAGSALIGAAWGVGHTVTVMAVGSAIIVFGVVIPPRLGMSMEFAVGIMLVT